MRGTVQTVGGQALNVGYSAETLGWSVNVGYTADTPEQAVNGGLSRSGTCLLPMLSRSKRQTVLNRGRRFLFSSRGL